MKYGDSGRSGDFGECGDSRADGDSGDSGEYGDFVEYGETGDSAYSDEFDDSSEYGNSGDSCDCGVSGKSNKSGYLAHKYMMLCCSARNKHTLVESFVLVLVRKVVSFQNYANGGGGEVEASCGDVVASRRFQIAIFQIK